MKFLYEWLNSINLLVYYTNFIESGFVAIEKIIENMTENNRPHYEDFENIGIKKPGHIFKMLTRLELEAKLIDEKYYYLIFEGKIPHSSFLRFSRDNTTCCGLGDDRVIKNDFKVLDLDSWLRRLNLLHLKKNFIKNGFDSIQYIILQMFSFIPINDEIVENCIHIYDKKERNIILEQLAKDANMVNIKFSRYSASPHDSIFEGETEQSCKMCSIF